MSNPSQRLESLFHQALALAPADRSAFLAAACGEDEPLLRQLEELLQAEADAGAFLPEEPQETVALKHELPTCSGEAVGSRIGSYKLLEKLGEGGFGEVWLAEQKEPVRRKVALKIIKLGMDTKQVIARFEAERQALALMDHPNIAKVLDGGETDQGRPYFVMDLVRGIPITRFCDENHLPTHQRLALFISVCQAVQHAHQKGIIHRDLKPANVLVTMHDAVPVTKVIDFGIAKATQGELTEKTIHTQFQQFIGTPAYVSPEQAGMSGLDIDTRSDIYSLGVLLYELLIGKTPFESQELLKSGLEEMLRTLWEKEPPRPSTKLASLSSEELTTAAKRRSADTARLVHQVQGDLDWIVMRCLEKDRTRRYETANGLAADLQRHLNNEPVVARPPSTAYKFQKAWRRNKMVFSAGAAVALALVVGAAVSAWQAVRATRAERDEKRLGRQIEASRQKALAESAKNERVAAVMMEITKTFDPTYWMECGPGGLDDALDAPTLRALEALQGKPEMEAEWCTQMMSIHHQLGLLQEFSQGIPYAWGSYSPEAKGKMFIPSNVQRLNWYANGPLVDRYRRLAELSRRVLRVYDQRVDSNTLAYAESLAACGDALRHVGELPEAKARLQEALALQRRSMGPTDLTIGQTLCQLAMVEKSLGETNAANADFNQGISIIADRLADYGAARAYVGLARAVWSVAPPSAVEYLLVLALDLFQKTEEPVTLSGLPGDRFASRTRHSSIRDLLGDVEPFLTVPKSAVYEEVLRLEGGILGTNHPAVNFLRMSGLAHGSLSDSDFRGSLPAHLSDLVQHYSTNLNVRIPKDLTRFTEVNQSPANSSTNARRSFSERLWPPERLWLLVLGQRLALRNQLAETSWQKGDTNGAQHATAGFVEELALLVGVDHTNTYSARHLALVQLWSGQTNEYVVSCHRLLGLAATSKDSFVLDQAAKACLVQTGWEPGLLRQAVAAGRQTVNLAAKGDSNLEWYRITAALANLRDGKFAEAEAGLSEVLDRSREVQDRKRLALACRSLARAHLGRRADALADLAAIEQSLARLPPRPTLSPLLFDPELIMARLLFDEAKALLTASSASPQP